MAKRTGIRLASMMVCMSLTTPVAPEILDRARKIKLFLMDVDGTLTDGSVNLISLPRRWRRGGDEGLQLTGWRG
jgi:hypothetical protein